MPSLFDLAQSESNILVFFAVCEVSETLSCIFWIEQQALKM